MRLSFRDVVKIFPTPEGGEVTAVNHVNLQIQHGEFYSLVRPFRLWQDDFSAHDGWF